MMAETTGGDARVWATQWYRITPRSFVHEELFFDPDRIVRAFAGESYKSFLLRRDGREEHANELGEEYRTLPAARLLEDEDNEAIPVEEVETIRLAAGSLLRKPKLTLERAGRDLEYYHPSRKHDVAALAAELREQYPGLPIESE
jgi:hypothetical protein